MILATVVAVAACTPAAALAPPAVAPTDAPVTTVPTAAGTDIAIVPVAPTPTVSRTWSPPARSKATGCAIQAGLPDPACTHGAVDPRVTQANISTTICTRGYTATVRPPLNITKPIKIERMAGGLSGQPLATADLDHLVPLELGGAPADVANLWPEPWAGDGNAHQKDTVETFLNREVCRGTMQLAEAQRQIATDWLSVYQTCGLHLTP